MKVPSKEQLPLLAPDQTFEVTEALVARFRKSFHSTLANPPFTMGAVALQGVFSLLRSMEVNWLGLLHATQKFEYHLPFQVGMELKAQTQLLDCRLRAGMYWLNFRTELTDTRTQQIVSTSKSLIMVKEKGPE